MAQITAELRSLYRRFLREIPIRSPSILANPSPVQRHIRKDLELAAEQKPSPAAQRTRIAEAEQYLQYLHSQRVYATLVERYNPGMNMEEEERIRLTARRVGMDLPVDVAKDQQD